MATAPLAHNQIGSLPAASAPAASARGAMLLAFIFYLFLLPRQFNPELGAFLITPGRTGLLLGAFWVIAAYVRREVRFLLPDACILGMIVWIFLSLYLTMGIESAISGSISQLLDIALAYFVGRALIRTPRDFRLFLILIAPGVAITGFIITAESVLGSPFMQEAAFALTGIGRPPQNIFRFGFLRSLGPFPHPILAGTIMGSLLPLYAMSGIRGWPKWLGILAPFSGIFTWSSSSFVSLFASIGLIVYNWLTEMISNLSWRLFLLVLGMVMAIVELLSQSGLFRFVMRYAAFNQGSSYNRVLIWNWGTESVMANPLWGIGYNDWVRPRWMSASIDNYWLLLTMQHGFVVLFLLLGVLLYSLIRLGKTATRLPLVDQRLLIGVAISIAVYAVGAFSVSLWLTAQFWFFALLGIGVSLGSISAPARAAPASSGPALTKPSLR
ncbi:hypothetical protein [Alteraurantiacibacter palmitatis]|uniref:O-antigen ligase domain-containing protein n=1 Tax=Alteraurantiacibacter palmitatis TaxID=2054628 RepID=A0ABV7E5I4_9SPHN